ncbi:putative methyltransferase NSUN7 [Alosa pseudoharengus]|uniref:putative methyltransferase NSUN7 n=1 Tax=Alosa pseudoharengus TaxID=34774 RepID=UPI003F8CD103
MVKQDTPRRTLSRSSKRNSQISSLKDLTLLDRTKSESRAGSASGSLPVFHPGGEVGWKGFPDRVYVLAAAIFQNTHVVKPAAHRLINFGKKTSGSMPVAKDDVTQRCAYELAFNALKYQELLEDIMIDSCFYLSQPMPDDLMSLVAVMLYDFQDRKFLPRERPANQREEPKPEVREVEKCLLKFKTKLAASLARCRIKHDLLTIDCILPDSVRKRQEKANSQPLYAWVNTLKTSLSEVLDVLMREGFAQVKSSRQLDGQTFCQDPHCQDLLAFPPQQNAELYRTKLLGQYKLIAQDKSCCVGPWLAGGLLVAEGDVLMAGVPSVLTVAHVAAIVALGPRGPGLSSSSSSSSNVSSSGPCRVYVCGGDLQPGHREELQESLVNMGCKNVKVLPEAFQALDVNDLRVQRTQLILLTPQCSVSAVCNPVGYLLQENGDTELLQDLSQGSIAQVKIDALVARQSKDLKHALNFPRVQSVVYCTCSVYPEENEELVSRVLAAGQEDQDRPPFRPNVAALPQQMCVGEVEEGQERGSRFFKLEPSEDSNGCFIAVLTREVEPEATETAQEVLARAAAKGLLDGIQTDPPPKKERRARQHHPHHRPGGPANQGRSSHPHPHPRPHGSVSSQSRVSDFLARQTKASHSAPAVGNHGSKSALASGGKIKLPSQQRQPKSVQPNRGSSGPMVSSSPRKPMGRTTSTTASSNTSSNISSNTSSNIFSKISSNTSSNISSITSSNTSSNISSITSSKISFNTSSNTSTTNTSTFTIHPNRLLALPAPPAPPMATVPPKGRQEVLRPMALLLPPAIFPGCPPALHKLPSRQSRTPPPMRSNPALSNPALSNPALSLLQWKSSHPSIPASRSSGSIQGMYIHPRPWL